MIEEYWNKIKDKMQCMSCRQPMYLGIIAILLLLLLVS
jgi:hypothetical protein